MRNKGLKIITGITWYIWTESQIIVPVSEAEMSHNDMYSYIVIKPMLIYSKVKGL